MHLPSHWTTEVHFTIVPKKKYKKKKELKGKDNKLNTGSLRLPIDLINMFDVPSSSNIRTWTLAEEAAEAAAAAACAAAAAASFALLEDPPLGIVGNLGGIADSSNANLSRHVSQAKSLALPESTMDQSLTL